VAAVAAAAKIRLAHRACVFPSYYLGNINLVFTFVAQRHKQGNVLVSICCCRSRQSGNWRWLSRISIAKFRLSIQQIQQLLAAVDCERRRIWWRGFLPGRVQKPHCVVFDND
jgi:hypothetical protein